MNGPCGTSSLRLLIDEYKHQYEQRDGASPTGDRPGELLTETVFFNREECYSQSQSNCATAAGTEMKNGSHAANAGEIR
ncbi:MAG: hypothetical protein KatS3mg112_0753 [Thermogutta sp.]|nr:MAG: hypothetical protein KatS3mg112_0753 [Thermogutta sp.]